MKRCANPLCDRLVSLNRQHVRIDERFFCSDDCRKVWMKDNDKLERVAHPLRYSAWTDECTCKKCAPPPDPGDPRQLSLQF